MEYEDRVAIATPEGVDLDLTLAGVGSRFAAGLVDTLIQYAIVLALLAGLGALGGDAGGSGDPREAGSSLALGIALASLVLFAVIWGYDVLFEVLGGGRTPGKRLLGLRVVREGGRPVNLRASAVRNLVRVLDGPLTSYAVGMVSVLVSKRNQRLGDLAAGTLVIRDRRVDPPQESSSSPAPGWDEGGAALQGWDVSAVRAEEIATVRRFLQRRASLEPAARVQLAQRLHERLAPRVAGAPEHLGAEAFLERLSRAKAQRGRSSDPFPSSARSV